MEIEEFINQDVLVFLDEALDKANTAGKPAETPVEDSAYIIRDYEKELTQALDKNHLLEAKRILYALKDEFDGSPAGSPAKKQLKELLIMLYERFKTHVDARGDDTTIDSTMKAAIEQARLSDSQTKGPFSLPPPPAPDQPRTDFAPLIMLLNITENHLRQGDLKEAVAAYKDAKDHALTVSGAIPVELSVRFQNIFKEIKKSLGERKQTVQSAEDTDKQLLRQLQDEKQRLDELIEKNDIAGCREQYNRMLNIAEQITDSASKRQVDEKMQRILQLLDDIAKHINDEQKLMAVP
jgi:hypothetical protein